MPIFRYQAIDAEQQAVTGQIEADSVTQAVERLSVKGLTLQVIAFATPAAKVDDELPATKAAASSGGDQAELRAHLAALIERIRPLTPALRAYAEELPAGKRRQQLSALMSALETGEGQAINALEELPPAWIPLLSSMASAHAPGGGLQAFLDESRRAEELRQQWRRALAYPLVVTGGAAAVIVFLSFVVIPVFRDIFRGFGLRLPALTQWVLTVAEWVASGKILMALVALAVFALVLKLVEKLSPPGLRDVWGDLVRSRLARPTALAQFTQFVADLLEAEWEMPAALRIAGYATPSLRLRNASWRLARQMKNGDASLDRSTTRSLTATVLYALQTDLSTEARVKLLREVSRCYSDRALRRLSWTRGLVEPICLCLVGLVVGITVVGLFLPLISLINGLA
jgi:type II secretory pathway component PulF